MKNIKKVNIDGGRVDGKVILNYYTENFLNAWCLDKEIFLDFKPEEDAFVAYSLDNDFNFCRI